MRRTYAPCPWFKHGSSTSNLQSKADIHYSPKCVATSLNDQYIQVYNTPVFDQRLLQMAFTDR